MKKKLERKFGEVKNKKQEVEDPINEINKLLNTFEQEGKVHGFQFD